MSCNVTTYEAIVTHIVQTVGASSILAKQLDNMPPAIQIAVQHTVAVCEVLHTHPDAYFDHLACITALDNGVEANTLEVIYQLYSIPYNLQLMLKVSIPRELPGDPLPKMPSVSHIWKSANWHEREAYDLLGIHFTQHPDLRRILMPADWKGYPLRKDYQTQQQYHGIDTAY